MTDDLLVTQAQWLPQYADEIPKAEQRLDEAVANGTRVHLMEGFQGAARLHTKTVGEMAKAGGRASAGRRQGKMTANA